MDFSISDMDGPLANDLRWVWNESGGSRPTPTKSCTYI